MNEHMSLGEQFNLGEANPDVGGGILYAARYTPGQLEYKTEDMLTTLYEAGYEFYEAGEGAVGLRRQDGGDMEQRALAMVEELSVLNDARAYQAFGWGVKHDTVDELVGAFTDEAMGVYDKLRETRGRDTQAKIDAFDMGTMFIPQVAGDLIYADQQNGVLTRRQRHAVSSLMGFAKHLELVTDGKHVITGR